MTTPFEVLLLQFNYTTNQGEEHQYLVEPYAINRVRLRSHEDPEWRSATEPHWVLEALVVSCDGEEQNMKQRAFEFTKIRDAEEVSKALP